MRPPRDLKAIAAVKLVVRATDQLVQVANRVRRKLVSVGQRQVRASGAIQRCEPHDVAGRHGGDALRLELAARLFEAAPLRPARFEQREDFHVRSNSGRAASKSTGAGRPVLMMTSAMCCGVLGSSGGASPPMNVRRYMAPSSVSGCVPTGSPSFSRRGAARYQAISARRCAPKRFRRSTYKLTARARLRLTSSLAGSSTAS